MSSLLEISPAEVLQSQLSDDDLRGLAPAGPSAIRCGGTYCEKDYSDDVQTEESTE